MTAVAEPHKSPTSQVKKAARTTLKPLAASEPASMETVLAESRATTHPPRRCGLSTVARDCRVERKRRMHHQRRREGEPHIHACGSID